MLLHKQLYRHNPPESFGDCHRTVYACLLGKPLESIPNFGEYLIPEERHAAENQWLAEQGLREVNFAFDSSLEHIFEVMKNCNPGIAYMLSGTSKNGTNHVVIAMDDAIIWDPAQDNSGIIGPCDMNDPNFPSYYWVSFLIPAPWAHVVSSFEVIVRPIELI